MLKQSNFRPVYRILFPGLIAIAVVAPTISALAQGVPHVSVDQTAYHTLIPPGTRIDASMCPVGSAFCLAAVGQPLLNNANGTMFLPYQTYGSDVNGNVYGTDTVNQILFRVSPAGQVTILAGEYGVTAPSYPPITGKAASTVLASPANIVVDASGNIYFSTGQFSDTVVMQIDAEGVAHRLTAPSALATPQPVEGALASSQWVQPASLSLDAAGDLYLTDQLSGALRVLSKKTGTLDTKYGLLGGGFPSGDPTDGENVRSLNIYSYGAALGVDGTVYLNSGGGSLYSVTTDSIAHLLATCRKCAFGGNVTARPGPASSGSIGAPQTYPTVDLAGNVYFPSFGEVINSDGEPPYYFYGYLVEVTKGSAASPSQILILSSGDGIEEDLPTLNPEGMPSGLIRNLQSHIALDSAGRIIMTSQNSAAGTATDRGAFGVAYLDRNGAGVFAAPSSETFTLTNSGSAALKSVNFARTGLPFYVSPTAAELKEVGGSGPAPFNLDLTRGSCVALYSKSGAVTLHPGESCTIVIDYKPNANIAAAGTVTFQTNDPRGPLTIALSHSTITPFTFDDGGYPETYNGLNISSTVLTPSSSVSNNGSFTLAVAVASSIYDQPGSANGVLALYGNQPVVPTGRVLTAITNNATGAVIVSPANSLDADGKTNFSFTGLAAGSYSLEGAYLGDGKSAASYSIVQTLIVAPH